MFGTMHIYEGDAYLQDKSLKKVGLEPFQKEFNAKYLINAMKSHPKKALKTLLLDQSIIAGIGNIYADEILYACKLNPTATISELKEKVKSSTHKFCVSIAFTKLSCALSPKNCNALTSTSSTTKDVHSTA